MNAVFLLCVLPALVLAKIQIDISPASQGVNASVRCSGSATWAITEMDQETFHVTDSQVSNDKIILGYKEPSVVLVRTNSYYNQNGVTVSLRPISAEIVSHKEETVVVALKEFNNHIPMATVFRGDVKEDVTEVMTTWWTETKNLNSGKNICLRFGAGRISLDIAWRERTHQSTRQTLSTNSGMEMTLQPGQRVQAVLNATKASIQVKVDYEATLDGNICARYIWALAIPELKCWEVHRYLESVSLPNAIRASEMITVDYYYNPSVDVKDNNHIDGYYNLL